MYYYNLYEQYISTAVSSSSSVNQALEKKGIAGRNQRSTSEVSKPPSFREKKQTYAGRDNLSPSEREKMDHDRLSRRTVG